MPQLISRHSVRKEFGLEMGALRGLEARGVLTVLRFGPCVYYDRAQLLHAIEMARSPDAALTAGVALRSGRRPYARRTPHAA